MKAGWTDEQISEQKPITDGRVVVAGTRVRRRPKKKPDYLLSLTRDLPLAVVEAKVEYKSASDGLQQAKDYAEILDLKFAYATNGKEIIEFDYLTGVERLVSGYPSPDDLWHRLREHKGFETDAADRFLTPFYHLSGKSPHILQLQAKTASELDAVLPAILDKAFKGEL
jgi:type I restriction enzyme R subunit